jgi:phospho-N-acetylmuramoyl-pentapeptide-transferase
MTMNQSLTGIRFFASGTNGDFLFDAGDPLILALVFLFLTIIVVGTCNAVNLTDGIDGLAAGLSVQIGFFLMLAGSNLYDVSTLTTLFWMALSGACLGFLFFNKYPARVFMGDTGSLALGAALGAAAVLSRAVFLLPFIGFIFYAELISVTAQVLYFKYTRRKTGEGQRLLRRAPLHHHYELGGWTEWRVVLTFWGVNFIVGAIGLLLWSMEILPRFP